MAFVYSGQLQDFPNYGQSQMSRTEQKLSVLWAAVPRIQGEKGSGLQTDKKRQLYLLFQSHNQRGI